MPGIEVFMRKSHHVKKKRTFKKLFVFIVFIIAGALLSNVSTEFAGILVLVALISLIYSIYTFFEVYLFQNLQGYKLHKKQKDWKKKCT